MQLNIRSLTRRKRAAQLRVGAQLGARQQGVQSGIAAQVEVRFNRSARQQGRHHVELDAHLGLQGVEIRAALIASRIRCSRMGHTDHDARHLVGPDRRLLGQQRGHLTGRLRKIAGWHRLVIDLHQLGHLAEPAQFSQLGGLAQRREQAGWAIQGRG